MGKRKKKNAVLGLDLGTQAVKAVEMSRQGDVLTVTGCAYEPVEDPAQYTEAIQTAIESGAFSVKQVIVGFSGRSTLLQTITVPADSGDLNMAVLEEAEKYIPYDISEAQLDHHVIDDSGGGPIKVLLAAVRQQDIEDKLEILFSAGITPVHIDVELVAITNALETVNAGGIFFPEDKPAGIVDFGASKTLIAITDGTNQVFREFPMGGIALTEMIAQRVGCDMAQAEKLKLEPGDKVDIIKDAIYPGIEDMTGEIRSCLETFKGVSGGREVQALLLSGGLVAFSGVAPLIGRMVRTETRIFDSFGAVDSSEMDSEFVDAHAHEFSIAFGLACHARN
ncbi:MAG: type IV pilus assembly protein PilM [Planctomycetes bacterium]|nr:type IV pilus assembly protein PilM [Planctomycetota bacterium]